MGWFAFLGIAFVLVGAVARRWFFIAIGLPLAVIALPLALLLQARAESSTTSSGLPFQAFGTHRLYTMILMGIAAAVAGAFAAAWPLLLIGILSAAIGTVWLTFDWRKRREWESTHHVDNGADGR